MESNRLKHATTGSVLVGEVFLVIMKHTSNVGRQGIYEKL